jgi:hypothetical protein
MNGAPALIEVIFASVQIRVGQLLAKRGAFSTRSKKFAAWQLIAIAPGPLV